MDAFRSCWLRVGLDQNSLPAADAGLYLLVHFCTMQAFAGSSSIELTLELSACLAFHFKIHRNFHSITSTSRPWNTDNAATDHI